LAYCRWSGGSYAGPGRTPANNERMKRDLYHVLWPTTGLTT